MNLSGGVLLLVAMTAVPLWPQVAFSPKAPMVWDESKLAEWATPLAGINVRPAHISVKQYYALRVDNLKTYPVYFPGR